MSSNCVTLSPGTSFQPNLRSPLIFSLPSTSNSPNSHLAFTSYKQTNLKFRAKPIKATSTRSSTRYIDSETNNFYDLLGIPETGTIPEIKQAYKKLALKYHPDVSPPDRVEENTRRFIQVKEAYQTLSNPRSRALYDRDMAGGGLPSCEQRWEERLAWERTWRSQLMELQRMSLNRDQNVTWGTRIRRRRETAPVPL